MSQPTTYNWGSNEIQVYQYEPTPENGLYFVQTVNTLPTSPKVLILGETLTNAGFDRDAHQHISMKIDYFKYKMVLLVGGEWDNVTIPMQQQMNSYANVEMARKALENSNLQNAAIYVTFCTDEQFNALFG